MSEPKGWRGGHNEPPTTPVPKPATPAPSPVPAEPKGSPSDANIGGSVPAGDEPKGEPVNDLIRDGIEAFRLTREYVGEDTLPAIEGWSWFDWCEKAREHLARPVSTPRLTDEQVQAIYAAYDQFGGGEAHTLEGRRSIVEPIADAVRAALAAGVHLTGDAPSPTEPMGAAAMADVLAAWNKIGEARDVAPSPDAPPTSGLDVGRWRRDGWHDAPCWREWIDNPEGGCTCD